MATAIWGWQIEKGRLVLKWSDSPTRQHYFPSWMREVESPPGSYLPPLPDFASHSPFGGAFWFEPIESRGLPE